MYETLTPNREFAGHTELHPEVGQTGQPVRQQKHSVADQCCIGRLQDVGASYGSISGGLAGLAIHRARNASTRGNWSYRREAAQRYPRSGARIHEAAAENEMIAVGSPVRKFCYEKNAQIVENQV